jgi:peptidoglycan/LPS O-acetylase OafA/YrhL
MKSVLIKEKKIRTLLFLTIVIAPVALVVGVQRGPHRPQAQSGRRMIFVRRRSYSCWLIAPVERALEIGKLLPL